MFLTQINKYICTSETLDMHITCFSSTQNQFRILYLPTQIQMDIVYQKLCFKHEFSRFLLQKDYT